MNEILGNKRAIQIGIIVKNIETTRAAWASLLGVPVPEIIFTDSLDKTKAEFKGQPTTALAKLAFFSLGQVTLELIEPIGTGSTWQEHLDANGQSLHHIAFEVKGMQEQIAMLAEHGLPLLQRGEYTGGRYSYLDGQEKFGAVIELLEND